ncbi:MAG: septum formation initiator family protein [Oscillospiraceae bacterium]|nr:septum formation initiator family protein [Oscillospiraceae bacterium]
MKLKKADAITKIVILLLLIFSIAGISSIRAKTEALRSQIAALEQEAANLEIENAELQYYVDHKDDDSIIGSIARKYWGYVNPNEKVFYHTEN